MAGWPELCWVMSQVRDRAASTGLRDVHLTCSNYWKQHWEHGNMEVVEEDFKLVWASWGTLRESQDCNVDAWVGLWTSLRFSPLSPMLKNKQMTACFPNAIYVLCIIKSVIQRQLLDKYGSAISGNQTCMDNDLTMCRHKWSTLIGVAVKGRRRGPNQREKWEIRR